MGEETKIQWCDMTFNPVIGCTKVSKGCDNCYAEAQNAFRKWNGGTWGPGAPRKVTSAANWRRPIAWNQAALEAGRRDRVFCASLADVFDHEWPVGVRERLWALIKATPALDWLLLTKRPANIKKMLPLDWGNGYPNVWLGATVEDQDAAEVRIKWLVDVPARVRFLSVEPQIGPVDLTRILYHKGDGANLPDVHFDCLRGHFLESDDMHPDAKIHWVIQGGESGGNARPFDIGWARSLAAQCEAAGASYFCKQLGRRPTGPVPAFKLKDGHGGDWDEWPASLAPLKVRQFPTAKP